MFATVELTVLATLQNKDIIIIIIFGSGLIAVV